MTLVFYLLLHSLLSRPTFSLKPPVHCVYSSQDSRSTTPAIIVDLGIGYPVYANDSCRRASISCIRGTNMIQFANRSDVIKFPTNLQKPH